MLFIRWTQGGAVVSGNQAVATHRLVIEAGALRAGRGGKKSFKKLWEEICKKHFTTLA